jgi:hypothetical protein
MSLPFRSRFTYTGGDMTVSLPARPWIPIDESIGGVRIAASGVPATYLVRRDVKLTLTLRFDESEWADILALVTAGQSGEGLVWYPDADSGTSFDVYLHTPAPGEVCTPTRDGGFPQMLEVTLTLRSVDNTDSLWPAYFA